jgi:hypothetical protein
MLGERAIEIKLVETWISIIGFMKTEAIVELS